MVISLQPYRDLWDETTQPQCKANVFKFVLPNHCFCPYNKVLIIRIIQPQAASRTKNSSRIQILYNKSKDPTLTLSTQVMSIKVNSVITERFCTSIFMCIMRTSVWRMLYKAAVCIYIISS